MRGYVKVHRQLLESTVWKDENPAALKVWLYCLLSANHTTTKARRGKEEITLMPGEFIYSRSTWSEDLQVRTSTLRNILERLIFWDMLEATMQDKGIPTIYKVTNWEKWQIEDNPKDTLKDNKRTTRGQLEDTLKNDNNARMKIPPTPQRGEMVGELGLNESELAMLGEDFPKVDIRKAYKFIQETRPANVHAAPAYVRKRIQTMVEDGSYPRKERSYVAKIGSRTFYTADEYNTFMATGV